MSDDIDIGTLFDPTEDGPKMLDADCLARKVDGLGSELRSP
jgi:hypothetical protein